jgi:hypothetical protein
MSDDFWANENWDSRATQVGATGRPEWRVSGRGMVLGMLAFGVLTTSTMWIYWTLHVGPFRPFQDALAAAFPHSSPRVDGGQRKMHKGTPKILRVVMRVEFDPVAELARGEDVVDVVEQIARKHLDLDAYEELEVFLFQGVPEQEVRQQEYKRTLRPSGKSAKSEKLPQNAGPHRTE